jgi:hypothetical protein
LANRGGTLPVVALTIRGEYAVVPLTKGKYATVDIADLPAVLPYKWAARKDYRQETYYAEAKIFRDGKFRTTGMHRVVMGAKPGELVDHIRGNGLDNRRAELRICDLGLNARNAHNRSTRKTSRYRGVYLHKQSGRWRACYAPPGGRAVYLGLYRTEEEAAMAYDRAVIRNVGTTVGLNFYREADLASLPAELTIAASQPAPAGAGGAAGEGSSSNKQMCTTGAQPVVSGPVCGRNVGGDGQGEHHE